MIGGGGGVLGELAAVVHERYEPYQHGAMVLFMVALSGPSLNPIAGRTVGNAPCQDQIALDIEQMLGFDRAPYLTATNDSQLVDLGMSKRLRTLLVNGRIRDQEVVDTISRLILKLPIRRLACGRAPDPNKRIASFRRNVAVIVIQGEDLDDPLVVPHMVTVKLLENKESVEFFGKWRLGQFLDNWSSPQSVKDISRHLRDIDLRVPVEFPNSQAILKSLGYDGDLARAEILLSLAGVAARLKASPPRWSPPIPGSEADLKFVISLLESAAVDDERLRLSPRTSAVLLALRTAVVAAEAKPVKPDPNNPKAKPPSTVAFCLYDVVRVPGLENLGQSAMA